MKTRPIIFSTELMKKILEGTKTQTRRVIKSNPDIVFDYRLLDDKIEVSHNDNWRLIYERHYSGEWHCIETDTGVPKRRLHGGIGWQYLFEDQVQGLWEKGIRGLVSFTGSSDQEEIPNCFLMSQQSEGNKISSSPGLYGFSRIARAKDASDKTPGWQSEKQPTGESSLGYSVRKLAGPKATRQGDGRGETSHGETDRSRTRTSSLGNTEGFMQSAPRSTNVEYESVCYVRNSPFIQGMRLWVREPWNAAAVPYLDIGTWYRDTPKSYRGPDCFIHTYYRASEHTQYVVMPDVPNDGDVALLKHTGFDDFLMPDKWNSARFMPKWACRLKLEVTNVRADRLQNIEHEDVCAELGVPIAGPATAMRDHHIYETDMRYNFSVLWDDINVRTGNSWASDPWVWIVDFKVFWNA